ncbi:ribosomal protein S6 kinase like isoform X2 [Andrena cerasifolii]
MGNSTSKRTYNNQNYISQCSLADLLAGSCVGLTHAINNESRSQARVTHKSWSENRLWEPTDTSKTLWPISRSQAMFLPEFQIKQVSLNTGYTFLNVIAKGAYGTVYKIQKQATGQCFALKIINKAKVVAENGIMQAKQEVAIQTMVGHYAFILDCNFRWQGKKTLYILSDYMSGGELYSLVDECGTLPEDVVRIYVAEIALAIDFLHNAGVVHRDIKATNILLDSEGHAVVIDFGFAKWLSRTQRTNTFCGTPEYMAPEIFKRQSYGHEVDWWSLGVLTCFMLTNEYPAGASSDLLPENRRTDFAPPGTIPPHEQISAAAEDLLMRLLQPDPCVRLKSLLGLQRIAFYLGHDVQSYVTKKEAPFRLLGRTPAREHERVNREFTNFDSPMRDDSLLEHTVNVPPN